MGNNELPQSKSEVTQFTLSDIGQPKEESLYLLLKRSLFRV
jgi:hypothetical protein